MTENPIEGLRAAIAELPDSTLILVEDDSGGRYVLREVSTVELDEVEPRLVLKVERLRGFDPEDEARLRESLEPYMVKNSGVLDSFVTGVKEGFLPEAESEYCSTYCEHNAGAECGCDACVWIRENAGFVHATGCRFG